MNLSLRDVNGGLLLVPQFTLAADTCKGTRPGFSRAAEPQRGRELFDYMLAQARRLHAPVESGRFGADMQVTLTNDGPVTLTLRTEPPVLNLTKVTLSNANSTGENPPAASAGGAKQT